ncbi:hypothetical protein VTP01DRAFT_7441 [Rhizomucor pusillus]|uniref:uncharacterized protein n=1 Tax=Rhizomucor pusillus TaxID=4840 RepID=UPI00374476B8
MSNVDLKFFGDVQQALETESDRKEEIRLKVREFDRTARQLTAKLNLVHADPKGPVPEVAFDLLKDSVHGLAKLIPEHQFYKYCDLWSRSMQQAIFLVVFKYYLDTETLAPISVIEDAIGFKVDTDNTLNEFHIQLEDVLHSYISLINELSRLAVNAVTVGDYVRPLRLSRFVKDVSAGFQMLNLKNDMLRKRFDGIKYDVKKIEEVVYDITLRGLQEEGQAAKRPKLEDK